MKLPHKLSVLIMLILASVFVSSCWDAVYINYPISETSDLRDRELLKGTWTIHAICVEDSTWENPPYDLAYVYLIACDNKGIMHIAFPEWDDKDQKFIIDEEEFTTAWIGGKRYLTFLDEADAGKYSLMLGVLQDDVFTICRPDEDLFKEAIENKELSGEIIYTYPDDKKFFKTKITSTLEELKAFLVKNKNKQLFNCECGSMKIKKITQESQTHNPNYTDEQLLKYKQVVTPRPANMIFEDCNGRWAEIKKCV